MGFQANVFEFKMTFPFGFLGGCWYLEIWRWKWHEMKSGVGYDLEVFQKWMGNTCFSYGPFWTRCHYVALQNDQVSFMSLWFVYYICLHMVPMVSMVQKQPQRFNDLKIFLCLLLAILQLPEGWFRSNQHAATRDGTHRTAVNINLGNAPSMYPFRAEFTKTHHCHHLGLSLGLFLDSVIFHRLVVVIGCEYLVHWHFSCYVPSLRNAPLERWVENLHLGPRIAHGKQVVGDAKPGVGKPEIWGWNNFTSR